MRFLLVEVKLLKLRNWKRYRLQRKDFYEFQCPTEALHYEYLTGTYLQTCKSSVNSSNF